MKKNIKHIYSIIVAILLLSISSITVFAEETTVPEITVGTQHATESNILSNDNICYMVDNTVYFNTNKLGNELIKVDPELFGKLKWDVPSATNNLGMLNLEYTSMQTQLSEYGYGDTYSLEIPEFKTGYSGSIIEEFNKAFPGAANVKLENATLPEGWSVNDIMSSAVTQRNAILSDYKNSEAYQSVSEIIDTSSIFKTASQTMSMPYLPSVQENAKKLGANISFSSVESLRNNAYQQYKNTSANNRGKSVDLAAAQFEVYKNAVNDFIAPYKNPTEEIKKIVNDNKENLKSMLNDIKPSWNSGNSNKINSSINSNLNNNEKDFVPYINKFNKVYENNIKQNQQNGDPFDTPWASDNYKIRK